MQRVMLLMALVFPALVVGAPADIAAIKEQLAKIIPDETPDSITESPVPGLYEVVFGPEVFYVSKSGRYMLQGDLIDAHRLNNLTEEKRSLGRRDLIASLDEKSMIVFRGKEQKHMVTVFTDVDCTYCRKLHREMADYNRAGITIRYVAFPRNGIDTESYYKMVSVWCAADRNAAMTLAKDGGNPEAKDCANPVKKHMAAGDRLGVSGTPTMVLEDGSVLPGYVDPRRLAHFLEQSDSAATGAGL